jgi:hypothetical protein
MPRTTITAISVTTTTLALALLAPAGAGAHGVWLEQDRKQATLYFGEFGDNLREASPGLLDKFVQPTAVLLSTAGERPVPVAKTAAGFVLEARAGKGESLIAQELNYPTLERKPAADGAAGGAGAGAKTAGAKAPGGGVAKPVRTAWTPAARLVPDLAARPARLALDIVPTGPGQGAGEFQVVYQGKPLPRAKVEILTPSGWGREESSDDDGKVKFTLPWKGAYLIKVHHVDSTPGERVTTRGKEPYDVASYSTALSFVTPSGLPAPAATPAAPPNKP